MSSASFKQEMPPRGGFGNVIWERIPLKKPWSGAKILAAYFMVSAVSIRLVVEGISRRRFLKRENDDVTVAIEPLLMAERDRMFLDQLRKNRDEERELMKNVPGWVVGTWYGEPLFKTIEDKMVEPLSLEYYAHTHPKERDNMHCYDFWY